MTAWVQFIASLKPIVGARHVLTSPRATLAYRRAFRGAVGDAAAVIRPGSLVEMWRVLELCAANEICVVMQAANTGLTGGSTPSDHPGRPTVVISGRRVARLHLLDGGRQAVCLPGTTLHQLETVLRPLGREPHSVIGSSCFGASVIGGVCNNSGGALIRRGPAYTELALFGRIDEDGVLRLVNHLGLELGDDPVEILSRLEAGDFVSTPVMARGSDCAYETQVRQITMSTPSRFNADPRCLHEASGSAGKIAVFAVRLDTFEAPPDTTTFYVGTNDPQVLSRLRLAMLSSPAPLPISAEYIHREAFDVSDQFGRDTFHLIRWLGTARLPRLFAWKAWLDDLGAAIGQEALADRLLQRLAAWLPDHLPARMREWRDRYEHHLILKVDAEGLAQTQEILSRTVSGDDGGCFECSVQETQSAWLHRFVTAGAALRQRVILGRGSAGLVALDIALPRNASEWFGSLPDDLTSDVLATLRYGHFFCHVFHRDYVLAAGVDPASFKQRLLTALDAEGAEYPAEHNVGRVYQAKPPLADFYRRLDPKNRFNPGIGGTPVDAEWAPAKTKGQLV